MTDVAKFPSFNNRIAALISSRHLVEFLDHCQHGRGLGLVDFQGLMLYERVKEIGGKFNGQAGSSG
jgi:hypothetical protein